jgi:hypothetical protein
MPHVHVSPAPAGAPRVSSPIASAAANLRSRMGVRTLPGLAVLASAVAGLALPATSHAHGFVGQRSFPATIATDDPFVADELSLPTVSLTRSNASDDAPASTQRTIAADFSKRITQNLGFSLGAAHDRIHPAGQPALSGFENVELGLKYNLYRNEAAETLMSAGMVWEVGGTGSNEVGADRFSTYKPTFYFGKGFGNAKADWARPFAVTGTVGVAVPGRSSTSSTSVDPDTGLPATQVQRNPHVLQLGFALEYSIPYLQSAVKDTGLGAPWNRMIPIVEVAAQRPLDRVADRSWTGTVNPGVLWAGRKMQFGLEAVIPMNRASGRGVGVLAQVHFFLDDIFPRTIGQPLIGGRP